MILALQLLTRCPGRLWIGPDLTILRHDRLHTVSLCWGWDEHDPISLLPHAHRTDYADVGALWSVGWLGFNACFAVCDVSEIRERAAELVRAIRLIEVQL
jgi:hypothetical protein